MTTATAPAQRRPLKPTPTRSAPQDRPLGRGDGRHELDAGQFHGSLNKASLAVLTEFAMDRALETHKATHRGRKWRNILDKLDRVLSS